MATYGGPKLSKRAAHKALVESRKDQPFVKMCKVGRRNALPFPKDFFTMARESEREGVLMTRVGKKPVTYRCETTDAKGNIITVGLQKLAPPLRGWSALLPKGVAFTFHTRRDALKFIGDLQTEVVEPPEEDKAPFSHNDVDEDGAIIDVDTDGNPMEYGK